MNTLTAMLLWMLSQLAPGDVVCVSMNLPPETCESERVTAELQPGEPPADESKGEAKKDDRVQLRPHLDMSRATRISNGF